MSEKTRILYYALWIAHPVLQTVIAIAMLRRGQQRAFKYFFAYIVTQIMTFAVVFPIYRYYYSAAFYVSWISTAISVALGFMVIHEAFLDVFRPFHTLRDLGTVLFKWAGLVMLLVAGVVSVSTSSSDMAAWVQAIMTAQRCVRIIQVGMVLFLLFFARHHLSPVHLSTFNPLYSEATTLTYLTLVLCLYVYLLFERSDVHEKFFTGYLLSNTKLLIAFAVSFVLGLAVAVAAHARRAEHAPA